MLIKTIFSSIILMLVTNSLYAQVCTVNSSEIASTRQSRTCSTYFTVSAR